jgi:hypothetical protein
MIVPSRHRPLVHDPWNETAVRAAIEEIAADAIAHFDPDGFWPGHPGGEGENDGDPVSTRARPVSCGPSSRRRDRRSCGLSPGLPKLMERTVADHEASSPPDYEKHGSLRGDMGAALLAMRLVPASNFADLGYSRAHANNRLPVRELMWGMPGSMVAAIHMAGMTAEPRWRGLFEMQAALLLADLEDTPQGPLWTQDLHGQRDRFSDLFTALPAMSFRCCAGGTG